MAAQRINIYKDKKIFVTGGTGFLGTVLVEKLTEAGANVFAPSRKLLDLTRSPLHIFRYNPRPPDLIFHLAAKVAGIVSNRFQPFDYLYENSLMADQIVRYAFDSSVPIVAAGSVCVYSDEAPLPFSEKDIFLGLPEATNLGYGLAKRHLLHLLLCAAAQDPAFRYAYVNSANLYGPGDHFGPTSHVIPALIHKVIAAPKNGDQVRVLGTGQATRDFLHVEDAANAYVMAGQHLLEDNDSLICNIGSGVEIKIDDVLATICNILNVQPDLVYDTGSVDGQKRRLVNSKVAYYELGWRPYKTLEQGIEETIAYYKTHYDPANVEESIRKTSSRA